MPTFDKLTICVFAAVLLLGQPLLGDEKRISELAARTSELIETQRFEEAIKSASECLELTREFRGAEHPETANAMTLLALVYLKAERFDEAQPHLEGALAVYEKTLGPEAGETIEVLSMLEYLYSEKLARIQRKIREYRPREAAAMIAAAEPEAEDEQATVDVYYATDRNETGSDDMNEAYGKDRGMLQYGKAVVSIPKNHTMGIVERPKWYKLEFSENPEKHVMIRELEKIADPAVFFNRIDELDHSDEAMVFIHGFNVLFDAAIRRTAQISYDIDFGGVSLAYSWPSQGSVRGYTVDKSQADWSYPHLATFLTELSTKGNFEKIHIVAHSMGTRVLCQAIKEAKARGADLSFANVILAAPDIDSQVFKEQLFESVDSSAERLTVYVSSDDAALKVSSKINGFTRLGLSQPNIVIIPKMDTVDASGIDTSLLGHSYYGNQKPVMEDILQVVIQGLEPKRRHLRIGSKGAWMFSKLNSLEEIAEQITELRGELNDTDKSDKETLSQIWSETKNLLALIEKMRGDDADAMAGDLGDAWWKAVKLKTDVQKALRAE